MSATGVLLLHILYLSMETKKGKNNFFHSAMGHAKKWRIHVIRTTVRVWGFLFALKSGTKTLSSRCLRNYLLWLCKTPCGLVYLYRHFCRDLLHSSSGDKKSSEVPRNVCKCVPYDMTSHTGRLAVKNCSTDLAKGGKTENNSLNSCFKIDKLKWRDSLCQRCYIS
jgi:hypothetical protein